MSTESFVTKANEEKEANSMSEKVLESVKENFLGLVAEVGLRMESSDCETFLGNLKGAGVDMSAFNEATLSLKEDDYSAIKGYSHPCDTNFFDVIPGEVNCGSDEENLCQLSVAVCYLFAEKMGYQEDALNSLVEALPKI